MTAWNLRCTRPTLALLALGLLVAPLAAGSPLQDKPPAPPPAGMGTPSSNPALEALRKELLETYLQVEKDFKALRGDSAEGLIAKLAAQLKAEAEKRPGGFLPEEEIPKIWSAAGLLGPLVAGRLADAYLDASGGGGSAEEVLARAILRVFPEETMVDNWDARFLDLDVVTRWTEASTPADPVPDPADMVLVPKGDLQVPDQRGRGWPDSGQKAEKRSVRAFYLDRTEVSCAAYAAFLATLRDAKVKERILPVGWTLSKKGEVAMPEGAGRLPVANLPYEGAASFAAHHGKRLPTEDEWERAARGNDQWLYPWGAEWVEGKAVAGGKPGPAPVGSTEGDISPFGILDLCGNVSEVCATLPDGKPVKGVPKATEQIVRRGGNFKEATEEAANDWRYVMGATAKSDLVGFRCAMDEKDFEKRYGKK